MILGIYAIYDRIAGYYTTPFYMRSDAEAVRAVTDLANDSNTTIGRNPGDYTLCQLGSWDDQSGRTLPLDQAVHLTGCAALVRLPRQPEQLVGEAVQ